MTTWPLTWLVQLWHITIWPLMWLVQPSQTPPHLACLYKWRVCSNKAELLRRNPSPLSVSSWPRGWVGRQEAHLSSGPLGFAEGSSTASLFLRSIPRRKQQITYKGTPIRLSADFSTETLQARREWHDLYKVMKGKNLQPRRLLYPARLSFTFGGEIKSFPDKQELREFSTTKPALQHMLKEIL